MARCPTVPIFRRSRRKCTDACSRTWTRRPRHRSPARCSTRCATSTDVLRERPPRGLHAGGPRRRALRSGARDRSSVLERVLDEIVFTKGATGASTLSLRLGSRQLLFPATSSSSRSSITHSNFVPWQFIAQRTGASFRVLPIDDAGEPQLDELDEMARLARSRSSPATSSPTRWETINSVETLSEWAHDQGAIVVVDGARAAPHVPVDVQTLGCDFFAFSSHKLCGPTGVGAFWGGASCSSRCRRSTSVAR